MNEQKKPCPNVSVLCRFRPMNNLEITNGNELVADFTTDSELMFHSTKEKNNYKFAFDRIFPSSTPQLSVYEYGVKGIIDSVLDGYNGTVLVYGQTASGKTYTMQGDVDNDEKMGIIPRMISHVFDHIYDSPPENEFMVKVSMIEIYQEKIRDLIETDKINLNIREDPLKGLFIEDISEHYVASPDEVVNIMKIGTENRAQASTNMNEHSSRSHSIFIMTINQNNKKDLVAKTGKLYLVDLAGSEKISKTGATGHTLEEAKIINKSLTTLGMVINSLTDGKSTHVPYRESKLTRVLQESLGGNSKTCLIITCSPSIYNESESLSTLRFGERAKRIKNKPHINKEVTVAELQVVIQNLEEQLAKANKRMNQLENFIESNHLQVPPSTDYISPNTVVNAKDLNGNDNNKKINDEDEEKKISEYLAKMDTNALSLTEKIINTITTLKESEEMSENKTEIIAQLINIRDNYEIREKEHNVKLKQIEDDLERVNRIKEKLQIDLIEKETREEEELDERKEHNANMNINNNNTSFNQQELNNQLAVMKSECCTFVNQLKSISNSNPQMLQMISEFQEKIIASSSSSSSSSQQQQQQHNTSNLNNISKEIQEEIISDIHHQQLEHKLIQTDTDTSELDALRENYDNEKIVLIKTIAEKSERVDQLDNDLIDLQSNYQLLQSLNKNDSKQNIERLMTLEKNLIELKRMLKESQVEKLFFENDNKKMFDIVKEKSERLEKLEKEKEEFKDRNLLRSTMKNNVIPVLKGGHLKNSLLIDSRIDYGKASTVKYMN